MIQGMPAWVEILFIVTVLITIVFFYFSNGRPKKAVLLILIWSAFHSFLALQGFYQNTDALPPRFGLIMIPIILFVIYGLTGKRKVWYLFVRNTKLSTFLHFVRLPIEIALFELFLHNMIPELMTYEGRNFDILIGITAPLVGYLYFKNKLSKKGLLIWNVIGLVLVLFIVVNALLSAEMPIQLFAFDQPNRALAYFPFVLLPATIIPIVVWTHISDIVKLRLEIKEEL